MAYARITQIQPVEIAQCIPKNPMYLRWRNTLGGWDYWLFGSTQTITFDITDAQTIDRFVADLEHADTLTDYTSKTAVKKITLGAEGLTTDQAEGLAELLYSVKVQVLINGSVTPPVWLTVLLIPGTFPLIETGEAFQSITFEIAFPQIFIQEQ